jgi:5-amino-6-(5-phosphoribosylamino)uracil reductase
VAPRAALDELWSLGHHVVLCEGGPRLLGTMIAEGVVDEWNQTIAPLLIGERGPRIIAGPESSPRRFALTRLLSDESHLFAGYQADDYG